MGGLCRCMVQACPHLPEPAMQALPPPHQHEGMGVSILHLLKPKSSEFAEGWLGRPSLFLPAPVIIEQGDFHQLFQHLWPRQEEENQQK